MFVGNVKSRGRSRGKRGRLLDNLGFGTLTGRNIKRNSRKSKVRVSHGTNGMFGTGVTLERQRGQT